MSYCASRFQTIRRRTNEVMVGQVGVGASHPIRLQSMTTSDTQDIAATVQQSIALAEVGCEIVRITAPNVAAARCLKDIRAKFTAAGFGHVPLVADIHFLPSAAMEAVEHVEKVRVNPGNYADKKKFAVREYSDSDYETELQRLHDAFAPLVKRSKELGRAMRIGTNHGSLSDRIMNRYGDTPLGMVESALEFAPHRRGAHDYRQFRPVDEIASNPKVAIDPGLPVARRPPGRARPGKHGTTRSISASPKPAKAKTAASRARSASARSCCDGLGDTIRVSLTEDSVYEIPVARAIADKAMALWQTTAANDQTPNSEPGNDGLDPYHFAKRETTTLTLAADTVVGPEQPPRVIVRVEAVAKLRDIAQQLGTKALKDTPAEGLLVPIATAGDLATLCEIAASTPLPVKFLALELSPALTPDILQPLLAMSRGRLLLVRSFESGDAQALAAFADLVRRHGHFLAAQIAPADFAGLDATLRQLGDDRLLFTLNSQPSTLSGASSHAVGAYRALVAALQRIGSHAPIWIRNTAGAAVRGDNSFLSKLLEASFLTGALLCDGVGDFVSIETEADVVRATKLTYNVLQGAGARISKTLYRATGFDQPCQRFDNPPPQGAAFEPGVSGAGTAGATGLPAACTAASTSPRSRSVACSAPETVSASRRARSRSASIKVTV
jgi:(E)-4-hydroxy-3-methylbut-2-enyl-diphosphate synthase